MKMSAKRIHLASILLVLVLLLAACERPFRSDSDDTGTGDATTTETEDGAADEGATEDGAAEDVADEPTAGADSGDTGSEEGAATDDEAGRPDTGTDEGEGAADQETSGDDGAADDDSATDEGAQQEDGDAAAGEGDDATGDEAADDDATGDDATGDDAAAGDDTDDEAADEGDDATDDDAAAGDETTGDEAAGEGDDAAAEGEADDTSGDDSTPMVHIVQAGENLYRIGLQYNVSWVAIAEANNLPNANAIYVGQQLTIPSAAAPPAETPAGEEVTHIVQAGETLHTIGLQYNVSWTQIAEANGLVNPNYIVVGQVLKIPTSAPGPAPQFVHTVKAGETLFILALRYGVVWTDIAAANDIEAPYVIFPGQQLVIPGG